MRVKIQRTMLFSAISAIILLGLFMILLLFSLKSLLVKHGSSSGEYIREVSSDSMRSLTAEMMTEISHLRADRADEVFSDIEGAIVIISECVSDLYNNPELYGESQIPPVSKDDMGKLKAMFAYAEDVDPEDEEIRKETSKLANLQEVLLSVNRSFINVSSDYIGTESGIFFSAERISQWTFTGDERLIFDPRQRPWYKAAVKKKGPVYTGVFPDADTGEPSISCGVPVYDKNNNLLGVAGVGIHLRSVHSDPNSIRGPVDLDEFFAIVNNEGRVLFSGKNMDGLRSFNDMDLRTCDNKELAGLATKAVSGAAGIAPVSLDGKDYYIAYYPMKTVGWTYLLALPQSQVLTPTENLIDHLDETTSKMLSSANHAIIISVAVVIAAIIIMVSVSANVSKQLSDRLVAPIEVLTRDVKRIEGDNLDFSTSVNTGDEVQALAEAFSSMTGRMKQYISDITTITAERERIGTELSVASNIQASMLPCTFPPFPERSEFDLFAKMDPAKEVGGDFYDFFFTDEDHLAIVIADVSGKGVPASLFMVIAKTLIKNHAQLNESLDAVLMNTNNQLCEGNGEDLFVTAWIGVVDLRTGEMNYADAGHEIPFVMHEDGTVITLHPQKKRPPLATIEDLKYNIDQFRLEAGDLLFIYTDGVPEATDSNDNLYGMKRLEKVCQAHYSDDPETFLVAVREDVDKFVGDAPQFDDLTMLGLKIHHFSQPSS